MNIPDGPQASVVIPVFNGERYLPDALESVLRQTYRPIECIVVDDGSTDRTARVAEQYGPPVRVSRRMNRGVSAARNQGALEARGEMLAFLDADDVWLPTRLERQMRIAVTGAVSAVLAGHQIVDEALHLIAVSGINRHPTRETMVLQEGTLPNVSSGMLISRDMFSEIGGFDERLSTSADWDFLFRLLGRAPVAFVGAPVLMYRQHAGGMSRNTGLMDRDMKVAYRKAFASSPELDPIRRRSYGRLHWMLGGSYWNAGSRADAARHVLQAVMYDPRILARLPGRVRRRARASWSS